MELKKHNNQHRNCSELWLPGANLYILKPFTSNVVCVPCTLYICVSLYVQITNDKKKLYFMVLFKHICVNKFSIPEIHSNQTEILIHVYTRTIFLYLSLSRSISLSPSGLSFPIYFHLLFTFSFVCVCECVDYLFKTISLGQIMCVNMESLCTHTTHTSEWGRKK